MISGTGWRHVLAVTRPALVLAAPSFIADRRTILESAGIPEAVRAGRSHELIDWLIRTSALQGISDAAAFAFEARAGSASYRAILEALACKPTCPRLRSYWHFEACSYRRHADQCAEPRHRHGCIVPQLPARKGALAVGAVALSQFVRDVADGDLIGWFDLRLAEADSPDPGEQRGRLLAASVSEPLAEISGIGPKVANMLLGDLLLAADPARERWVAAGASMIAVDSLVHAWMHRTGILRRFKAEHTYGPGCYARGGCADIIEGLARRIDSRTVDPEAPAYCPRLVQHAVWSFCAEGGGDICNGRQIDDRGPCTQRFCPVGPHCDRLALHPR